MVDAEKIIAEIRRLKTEIQGYSVQEALDYIESYINLQEQSSLPSNLDEAAEEYGYINWQSEDYHEGASEGLPFDAIGHTANCFKAGAKWMAGKWETIDGEITTTSDNGWEIIRIPKKLYPLGTKVTVQIRKKQ